MTDNEAPNHRCNLNLAIIVTEPNVPNLMISYLQNLSQFINESNHIFLQNCFEEGGENNPFHITATTGRNEIESYLKGANNKNNNKSNASDYDTPLFITGLASAYTAFLRDELTSEPYAAAHPQDVPQKPSYEYLIISGCTFNIKDDET